MSALGPIREITLRALAALAGSRRPARQFPDVSGLRAEVMRRAQADSRFKDFRPDPEHPARFHYVVIGAQDEFPMTADVSNLHGYIAQAGEDPETMLSAFVATLAAAASAPRGQTSLLVANVRALDDPGLVQALAGKPADAESDIMFEPFVGDLIRLYQYDLTTGLRSARWSDFADVPRDELRKIAMTNLSKFLPTVMGHDAADPSLAMFRIGGSTSLTPGLLLLDEFWRILEKRFPAGMLAIVPRRDQLFVIDKRRDDAAQLARRLVEATFEDGFGLVSEQIFEWRDGALKTYAD